MGLLFTPMKIKNMEVPNRFVRSATADRLTEGPGHVSDKKIALYSLLAEGGVGLIITGITRVHPTGQTSLSQSSIDNDGCIPGLKRLTRAVHERGAKIALQLHHAGREAARFRNSMNLEALAPSLVEDDPFYKGKHRAITEDEIWKVIRAYGDASKRAREAGFDAVQLHAAHAYFPSQFLSPFTNRRKDGWGGGLQNRLRFHHEIYRDIRKKAGDDYPVLVKLGVEDGFLGGLEFGEGLQAAERIAQWGVDALEISQGLRGRDFEGTEFRTGIDSLEKEAYFRHWSKAVKKRVSAPVMMVGGLRTVALMEEVLDKGEADFISLCRPLVREPYIINDWKKGDRRRSACISCNKCLERLRKDGTLHCIFEKESYKGT